MNIKATQYIEVKIDKSTQNEIAIDVICQKAKLPGFGHESYVSVNEDGDLIHYTGRSPRDEEENLGKATPLQKAALMVINAIRK